MTSLSVHETLGLMNRPLRPTECLDFMARTQEKRAGLGPGLWSYIRDMNPGASQKVLQGMMSFAWSAVDSTKYGEAILISSDTLRLIEFASLSYVEDSDEKMDIDLPPLQRAVLFFEDPIPLRFILGEGTRPMSSTKARVLVDAVGFYDSRADDPDPDAENNPLQVYIVWARDERAPRLSMEADTSFMSLLFVGPNTPVMNLNREPPGLRANPEYDQGFYDRGDMHVLLQSFWALLRQPIIGEERARPIEPHIRKKRKKTPNLAEVRVLHLRQRAVASVPKPGGAAKRYELHHRFIVRGFWRNQFWGPKRAYRRRIWVDSYVKGPADAPLVISKRVYRE